MSIKRFTKSVGVAVVVAVMAFVMAGCGSDDPERNSDLVGIWANSMDGVQFKSNGDLIGLERYDGEWYGIKEGIKWSTKGDNLVLSFMGQSFNVAYAISGNTLTIIDDDDGDIYTTSYTKRDDITITKTFNSWEAFEKEFGLWKRPDTGARKGLFRKL